MRAVTMMQSQWKAETKTGNALCFENCKGGYFSEKKEYTLKIKGKSSKDRSESYEGAVNILPAQCVKAGSKIKIAESEGEVLIPCDLYEGDVYFPVLGIVNRADGTTEQYLPQSMEAPKGNVNVVQEPLDLEAVLIATMLCKR